MLKGILFFVYGASWWLWLLVPVGLQQRICVPGCGGFGPHTPVCLPELNIWVADGGGSALSFADWVGQSPWPHLILAQLENFRVALILAS